MELADTDRKDNMEEGCSNQYADICLLSSNISCEIENQLKPIIGFTDLLLGSNLNEKDKIELLNEIKNKGYNIYSITFKLDELSLLVSGRYTLKFEIFDLHQILVEIRKKFAPLNKIRGNKLRIHNRLREKNDLITTDKNALIRIITYITDNAIFFTRNGKIFICTEIIENKYLEILIKDTGIGISEESQHKIYEPFYKAKNNFNGGLGIGLTIVKTFVDILDGKISVRSNIFGTTFRVLIPVN